MWKMIIFKDIWNHYFYEEHFLATHIVNVQANVDGIDFKYKIVEYTGFHSITFILLTF